MSERLRLGDDCLVYLTAEDPDEVGVPYACNDPLSPKPTNMLLRISVCGCLAQDIVLDKEQATIIGNKMVEIGKSLEGPKPKIDNKVEAHRQLCDELNQLYAKKNADYGDSFGKTFEEEGFAMARIRLSDKLNRFKTLSRGANQKVSDESIRDTLVDLANYALMTVLEMDIRGKVEES